MARQRAFTQDELLDATEYLLTERGYEGFQLKLLAETLSGARSTIYEYYSNKDEIVAACMRRMMEKIMISCEGLEHLESITAIKKILIIFLEQANFHKIVQEAPKVDQTTSERAKIDLHYLEKSHLDLKQQLMSLFERAQAEKKLRNDIPLPVIVAVFFHAIETPNWLMLPLDQWAEQLFDLWWTGGGQNFVN